MCDPRNPTTDPSPLSSQTVLAGLLQAQQGSAEATDPSRTALDEVADPNFQAEALTDAVMLQLLGGGGAATREGHDSDVHDAGLRPVQQTRKGGR